MRFLFTQMIIIILVCIFIAALSNLTELGVVGWIIASSTGHALYKIFKLMHNSFSSTKSEEHRSSSNPASSNLSRQLQSFMFDDATGTRGE